MQPSRRQHRSLRHAVPSLHGLLLFEAAARHLNFSSAADELAITQPAVSHGIRQLEEALGQPLFLREHRMLRLTSHGQRLFASVSNGFAAITEAIAEIVNTPHREFLVVGASTIMASECLMPLLPRLHRDIPGLLVEIRNTERDPELSSSDIDVHIRLGDGKWPGHETVPLWPERIGAVCSPAYLADHGPVGDVRDLMGLDLIQYVDRQRYRFGWAEWFRADDLSFPLSSPVSIRTNDSLLALRAAEHDQGIALGWFPLINRAIDAGRVVLAHSRVVETESRFYAVSIPDPIRSRPIAAFCEWLAQQDL